MSTRITIEEGMYCVRCSECEPVFPGWIAGYSNEIAAKKGAAVHTRRGLHGVDLLRLEEW